MRLNFIKFSRLNVILNSNFAAHRWRYKHGFFRYTNCLPDRCLISICGFTSDTSLWLSCHFSLRIQGRMPFKLTIIREKCEISKIVREKFHNHWQNSHLCLRLHFFFFLSMASQITTKTKLSYLLFKLFQPITQRCSRLQKRWYCMKEQTDNLIWNQCQKPHSCVLGHSYLRKDLP